MSLFLRKWFRLENTRPGRFLESYSNAEKYYIELDDTRLDKKSFVEIFKYLKIIFLYHDNQQIVDIINDILLIYPNIFSTITASKKERLSIISEFGENHIDIAYKFDFQTIYLASIFLKENLRNIGISKMLFRKLIPFCLKYNFKFINGFAMDIGRYAWARFGFTARDEHLRNQKKILKMLYLGNADMEIDRIKHTAEIASARLKGIETHLGLLDEIIDVKGHYWTMWKLLRSHIVNKNPIFWLNNEFLIGKWSLLGGDAMGSISGIVYPVDVESWIMYLDFHDAFSMNLLRSYIGLTESEDQDIDASFWRDIPNAISIEVTDNLIDEEYNQ